MVTGRMPAFIADRIAGLGAPPTRLTRPRRTRVFRRCRYRCLRLGRLLVMSTTIRVSEETRDRIASLSNATGRPMTRILDEAIEALERKTFFDTFNRRYRELRDDATAWSEIEEERRVEEGALGDISA
jgi:predicted transcriptional regulator